MALDDQAGSLGPPSPPRPPSPPPSLDTSSIDPDATDVLPVKAVALSPHPSSCCVNHRQINQCAIACNSHFPLSTESILFLSLKCRVTHKSRTLSHTRTPERKERGNPFTFHPIHITRTGPAATACRELRGPSFFFSNTYSIYILYTYLNIFCLHETPPPRNPGQRIHQMAPFTHKRKEKSIFFCFYEYHLHSFE